MSKELQQDVLFTAHNFTSPMYHINKQEFLDVANKVSDQYLDEVKKEAILDKIYPLFQTDSFHNDSRLDSLLLYIASTAWNILYDQGYDMDNFSTTITDMWAQEHHHLSSHVEHVHSFGSQITGFYILEAPEDCSKLAIHDPRPAKRQINLPLRLHDQLSMGSLSVYHTPKAGDLFLVNSYVPHEFTRNVSDKPFKFIHFNVGVIYSGAQVDQSKPTVEII